MMQIIPVGDAAILIKTGTEISPETNLEIRKLMHIFEQSILSGLLELVPAYTDILVYYDPYRIGFEEMCSMIRDAAAQRSGMILPCPQILHVPVLYGGEYGPDLPEVASRSKLTENEVIEIHTSVDYLVYMLGFTPGFCYLGGLNPKIAAERRQSPRLQIPAGAVGIAGKQTGVYPVESPGGWQIIGRTPLRMFDAMRNTVFLVSMGDYIRFYAIDQQGFKRIETGVSSGNFVVQKTEIK